MKLKAKRRDKQNENVGNMIGKGGFEEQGDYFGLRKLNILCSF
jgi:hypothetical protein